MTATSQIPRGPVVAQLNFFSPPADGSRPHNNLGEKRDSPLARNYSYDPHDVAIEDLRGQEDRFNLDKDAFQVVLDQPPSQETAFADDESIRRNYYPELERLLLSQIPGSTSVVFFDHTIRRADPAAHRPPVTYVHIDQTAKSAAQRVRRHRPADADRLLAGRYRIVNVWRPLNAKPLESFPLAFGSSSSVDDADVVPIEHRYPDGYVGEINGVRHNDGQKWFYLSGMTGRERLLIECFDSDSLRPGSKVQGGRVPHTAFQDPRTRPDAEGRESIEVRALVFGP